MSEQFHEPKPRRSLREVVCDIDKDILRLLMRRHNLLRKMHNAKGFLEPTEEKVIRESWESAAARVSRDARLSSHFFSLMQEVTFLPRPEEGEERRQAFNLAPLPHAVQAEMDAPLACRAARAWLFLAAVTGQPLNLGPCLMNDALVDCVKLCNQLGAALTREEGRVLAMPTNPIGTPDKVLHVGDSLWNFYLALAHYLGRPSRAKFTGEGALKFVNLSSVARFLPSLGARLVHVIPKSAGFPVRVECSGVLPDTLVFPTDAPIEFAEALLLAAPFYERSFCLDLSHHAEKALVQERTLPLLQQLQAHIDVQGDRFRVKPTALELPRQPQIPMETELAFSLLSFALGLGGRVVLKGQYPQTPSAKAELAFLRALGASIEETESALSCQCSQPLSHVSLEAAQQGAALSQELRPLVAALTALGALRQGQAALCPEEAPLFAQERDEFFADLGLTIAEDQQSIFDTTKHGEGDDSAPRRATVHPWNAPSASWALALALAACAHEQGQGFKLGNPGVVTGLYPAFWQWYNGLPSPKVQKAQNVAVPGEQTRRRRVITNVDAVLPDPKEED